MKSATRRTRQSQQRTFDDLQLVGVIRDYRAVRNLYADALRSFGDTVADETKMLVPDSQIATAADRAQTGVPPGSKVAGSTVQNAEGHVIGSVTRKGYFVQSEAQKRAMEAREGYNKARRRLEDYCALRGKERFLLALRDTDVTAATGQGVIEALDDHIEKLLGLASPEDRLALEIEFDLGKALKRSRGKLTQKQVADELGVPLRTYQGWEAGKHPPTGNRRQAAETWIRERHTKVAIRRRLLSTDLPRAGMR